MEETTLVVSRFILSPWRVVLLGASLVVLTCGVGFWRDRRDALTGARRTLVKAAVGVSAVVVALGVLTIGRILYAF